MNRVENRSSSQGGSRSSSKSKREVVVVVVVVVVEVVKVVRVVVVVVVMVEKRRSSINSNSKGGPTLDVASYTCCKNVSLSYVLHRLCGLAVRHSLRNREMRGSTPR
ncbi:hypothetical protein ElyMa_003072300 [Elysia marginata]|uniref:Transmembrane protein n=1 Tax=Elysia marginata TaxID=1093978 RepID=A0AAV4IEQ8_9GAST|nr:hypothetical protein ElyMa_003072300 [Elysia marginata]